MFAKIYSRIQLLRFIPHIIVYARSRDRELLDYERDLWLHYCNGGQDMLDRVPVSTYGK